jgi:maleate isomerase
MKNSYRIGQIVPSSNTTMETEIPFIFKEREKHFSEKFTFHSSRMRMHSVTLEELQSMNKHTERCAAELADARVDLMSTACLVAIMAQGPGFHRQVELDMDRAVKLANAESKVMTSAGALIYGLKKMNAKKISFLAPYMKPLTEKVVNYIEAEGIEVVDRLSFEISDNLSVGLKNPMELLDDVKKLNTANVDVVVLSACVQMQSVPAIDQAEKMLEKPVVSTSICTVRNMLDLLDLDYSIPGFGQLLV